MIIENDELFLLEKKKRKFVVLIIYDISDNKRRTKLSKLLESYGNRVQKSAYEARLDRNLYDKLVVDIKRVIIESDNVRIYRMKNYDEILVMGSKDYSLEDDDVIII